MQKKYNYKPRQNYTGYHKKNHLPQNNSSFLNKTLNAMIFCVAVVILLYILKFFNVSFATDLIEKAKYVFNEDSSYLQITKEKVVGFMDTAVASVFGETKMPSSAEQIMLMPCEGDVVVRFGEKNETYHIDSSLGLLIKTKKDCDVSAAAKGEVKELLPSAYGGIRMIVVDGDLTTVYDGIHTPLVEKGDIVARGQLLGKMNDMQNKGDVLCFEVYLSNQPVDPQTYINPASSTEVEKNQTQEQNV